MVDRVEVISLKHREERRQRALARIAQHLPDLSVHVFDAIELRPGWRGCRESHFALWRQAVAENRTMLVMEDDVTFVPDFRERLSGLLEDLPANWDVLFLGGYEQGRRLKLTERLSQSSRVMWTHAYFITPEAAAFSLEVCQRVETQVDRAWAGYMGFLNVFRATPWLCGQEDGISDTGHGWAVGRDVVPKTPQRRR